MSVMASTRISVSRTPTGWKISAVSARTAKLFVDAGLIVLVSFISPFRSERRMARELVGPGEFIEVFVDTPLEVCMQRDPKGLYQKAKTGAIKNFTGIDSPYEAPEQAELTIHTVQAEPEVHAQKVVAWLRDKGYSARSAIRKSGYRFSVRSRDNSIN